MGHKYLVNMLDNLLKMCENYLTQLEKMKRNLEIKVQFTSLFLIKQMQYLGKEAAITVEQVIIYLILAARDDVVNQLLTNLDGV